MKYDILKCILGQVEFGPTDSPDIQNMSARNFESGRMSSRVEILFRPRMSANDSGELFGEIDTYNQRLNLDVIPKA